MKKELNEEILKKEQAQTKEIQKMKTQVIAETEKKAEAKQTEAMNELANTNLKKVKKLNQQLKDKETQLDKEVDRSNELTNKLNDVQAAAYMKDQKIKKMNEEGLKLKKALSQEEKNISSETSSLKKLQEEKSLISYKLEQAKKQITE